MRCKGVQYPLRLPRKVAGWGTMAMVLVSLLPFQNYDDYDGGQTMVAFDASLQF